MPKTKNKKPKTKWSQGLPESRWEYDTTYETKFAEL